MQLFMCGECGVIEQPSLSELGYNADKSKKSICSECKTGSWHGKFDKTPADGCFVDEDNWLYTQEEAQLGIHKQKNATLVGKVVGKKIVIPTKEVLIIKSMQGLIRYMHDVVVFEADSLYWKTRPLKHFTSIKGYINFNKKHAGNKINNHFKFYYQKTLVKMTVAECERLFKLY